MSCSAVRRLSHIKYHTFKFLACSIPEILVTFPSFVPIINSCSSSSFTSTISPGTTIRSTGATWASGSASSTIVQSPQTVAFIVLRITGDRMSGVFIVELASLARPGSSLRQCSVNSMVVSLGNDRVVNLAKGATQPLLSSSNRMSWNRTLVKYMYDMRASVTTNHRPWLTP